MGGFMIFIIVLVIILVLLALCVVRIVPQANPFQSADFRPCSKKSAVKRAGGGFCTAAGYHKG